MINREQRLQARVGIRVGEGVLFTTVCPCGLEGEAVRDAACSGALRSFPFSSVKWGGGRGGGGRGWWCRDHPSGRITIA